MEQRLGLMCVHAHPDDECISTGGILARYAAEGLRSAVVTCTGGERGEIYGADMDPVEVRPRLAEIRLAELERALRILGAGPPRMLGYRDSGMVGTEGNDDPDSFWRADFDEAVGRLVAHVREFRPDVLVTYDGFGGYGHPDHLQAHRVGLVAAEACAFPRLYPQAGPAWRVRKVYVVTMSRSVVVDANRELTRLGLPSPFGTADRVEDVTVGTPDELITTRADVRPWLDVKMDALRAHYSQVGERSFFFNVLNVPGRLARVTFGAERFVRQRSDVPVPADEDDLFAGLPGRAGHG